MTSWGERIRAVLDSQQVGETVIQGSSKGVITGAGAGVLGFVTQVNWIGVLGVLVALAGVLINLYFQHRRDQREERESLHRMSLENERAKRRKENVC